MKTAEQEIVTTGRELVRALTNKQVEDLLTTIFDLLDEQRLNELCSKVDKDIATTLSRLVALKTQDAQQPSPKGVISGQKYIEEWESLWSEWADVVFEVSEEKGQYVCQDNDWDPPYFDEYSLADDLDRIAKKMLPRIEKIHELGAEKENAFLEGLQEIENGIHNLPEWLGADQDGIYLGQATTQCILKWEWLIACAKTLQPVTFVERIIAIETASPLANLHRDAAVEFFKSLPEEARRQIYEYITANRENPQWKNRLRSSHSTWHQVYQALAKSFDKETYLENCRELLHENWRYGLPLVENLLTKKNYSEAAKAIEQTFSSYLHDLTNKNWKPENSLLISFLRYAYQSPEKEIIKLLKQWIVIAEKSGQAERSAALRLQHVTYEKPYQWEAVIEVYRELREIPYASTIAKLFNQWQAFIVEHSLPSTWDTERTISDSWIHWLTETGLEEAKDEKWFAQKVESWLEHLHQNPAEFKKQHSLVYTLTSDLAQKSNLKKEYPKLFGFVLNDSYMNRASAPARRAWLETMHGEKFIPQLMNCWKQNVATLVPDPAQAEKSRYQAQASWLMVANELNPAACRATINKWKIDHKKRRNLWVALEAKNLPM